MKKIALLVVALFAFGAMGCAKKDEVKKDDTKKEEKKDEKKDEKKEEKK